MKGKKILLGTVVGILVLAVAVQVLRFGYTQFMHSSYPRPEEYQALVTQASADTGVNEALIYAVIRTESGFRPQVESHAGAIGLMQITPATFDWIRFMTGWDEPLTSEDLNDPAVNIKYGTQLLSILLTEFETQDEALAAYNAGRSRVNQWLKDPECSKDGETLSYIPIEETRNYVKKVEDARQTYQRLYYNTASSQK